MPRKPPGKPPGQRTSRDHRHDPNDIRYIAIHEAGHAVTAILLGINLRGVDIERRRMPDGQVSVGFTDTGPVGLNPARGDLEEQARPLLIQCMAGSLAETRVNPRYIEGGGHRKDKRDTWMIAIAATCAPVDKGGGMVEYSLAEQTRNRERMDAMIGSAIEEADRLVDAHWPAIERVAGLLIERGSLTGAEVAEVVRASADPGADIADVE